jgi:hypothetical protein
MSTIFFESLPISLAARIVSFNVETTADIARLSNISRSFKQMVISHIKAGHCIKCPGRQPYNKSYIHDLIEAESEDYEVFEITPGDVFNAQRICHKIFDGNRVVFESFMTVCSKNAPATELEDGEPRCLNFDAELLKDQYVESIWVATRCLMQASTLGDLKELLKSDGCSIQNLFLPINKPRQHH